MPIAPTDKIKAADAKYELLLSVALACVVSLVSTEPYKRVRAKEMIMNGNGFALVPKWYTVAQVASLLGYGESRVQMLIIGGDLRSLKDGRSRRILPEWVDEYVQMRASQAEATWWSQ
jgi:excisionase family DNA binding protein